MNDIDRALHERVRWSGEDGDFWGIGHHNKTAFAAWARAEYLAGVLFEGADDELYSLELHCAFETYRACDVFHAWADMDTEEEDEWRYDEPREGLVPITGLYA